MKKIYGYLLVAAVMLASIGLPRIALACLGCDAPASELEVGWEVFSLGIIINQNTVAGIYRSFSTIFNQAFSGVDPMWSRIAMLVPSNAREVSYNWLGNFPKLREWVGDRIIKDLTAFNYSIANKDWESTIEVDRNDIQDDLYGTYNPIVSEMGRAAAAHPDELIFVTLLPDGFSTECYDGQFFFDTDHPVGAGTASNFATGAESAWYLMDTSRAVKPLIFQSRKEPEFVVMDRADDENVFTRRKFRYGVDRRDNAGYGLWQLAYGSKLELTATNYAAAREAMMAFTDDEGKPLGVMPNLLVVHPGNEGAARTILLNDRDAAGATNPWKGSAEFMVSPWLT
jgi:phage major head subunit gpT-like protein